MMINMPNCFKCNNPQLSFIEALKSSLANSEMNLSHITDLLEESRKENERLKQELKETKQFWYEQLEDEKNLSKSQKDALVTENERLKCMLELTTNLKQQAEVEVARLEQELSQHKNEAVEHK